MFAQHKKTGMMKVAAESAIHENWCLLKNHSTCNTFINGNYLSNIIDSLNRQYPCFHCNAVVTYTNNIGELPRSTTLYRNRGNLNTTATSPGTRVLHSLYATVLDIVPAGWTQDLMTGGRLPSEVDKTQHITGTLHAPPCAGFSSDTGGCEQPPTALAQVWHLRHMEDSQWNVPGHGNVLQGVGEEVEAT